MFAWARARALPRVAMRILLMPKGWPRAGSNLGGRATRSDQRLRFLGDDGFATCDFIFALLEIIVGNRLQVIDVVEVDVFQEVNFRFDVARDGDVDQEQGAVSAPVHERFEFGAVQNVMRGRRAADDDVDPLEFRGPFFEMDGAAAEFLRKSDRALVRPV